jgi:hypothetical protein
MPKHQLDEVDLILYIIAITRRIYIIRNINNLTQAYIDLIDLGLSSQCPLCDYYGCYHCPAGRTWGDSYCPDLLDRVRQNKSLLPSLTSKYYFLVRKLEAMEVSD